MQKDEIIKTYRKFVKGVNPDLEMTFELKNAGFGNVQDIRGYFYIKTGTEKGTLLL